MTLQCFVCAQTFKRNVSELQAERINFCSEDCKQAFKEWAKQYEEISLSRYYLIRKLTKRKNWHEPLGK